MSETPVSKEPEKFVPTVGIIVMNADKVLTARAGVDSRQKLGIYGLPAGRIEPGETARQAAQRELDEETGLEANEEDLIEFPGNFFKGPVELRNRIENMEWTVFICKKYEGDLKAEGREGGKTIPEWIPIKKLSLYETMPNVPEVIANAQKFLANGVSQK